MGERIPESIWHTDGTTTLDDTLIHAVEMGTHTFVNVLNSAVETGTQAFGAKPSHRQW